MDRRDFLKRWIAASALDALSLGIEKHDAISQAAENKVGSNETVKSLPTGKTGPSTSLRTSSVTTNRLICGGNLFNGYAHGRDSVDVSNLRSHRARLSQTGFLAGWQPDSGLGPYELLWKGAY